MFSTSMSKYREYLLIKNNLEKNVLRENRKHSMDQEQIIILQWTLVLGI